MLRDPSAPAKFSLYQPACDKYAAEMNEPLQDIVFSMFVLRRLWTYEDGGLDKHFYGF